MALATPRQNRLLFASKRRAETPRGAGVRSITGAPSQGPARVSAAGATASPRQPKRGKQARYATKPLREIKRRVAKRRG